jgi:hypothetical protein
VIEVTAPQPPVSFAGARPGLRCAHQEVPSSSGGREPATVPASSKVAAAAVHKQMKPRMRNPVRGRRALHPPARSQRSSLAGRLREGPQHSQARSYKKTFLRSSAVNDFCFPSSSRHLRCTRYSAPISNTNWSMSVSPASRLARFTIVPKAAL